MAKVNGIALAGLATGIVFLYSGIKGKSISQSVQYIIQGKNPGGAPTANPITGSAALGNGANVAAAPIVAGGGNAQQALLNAAANYGWGTGAEWQALQNVEMAEAGFNPTARNPSSGAFGLAQALGHGTANTAAPDGTNEYGGYGLSDQEAQQANSGDPTAQAIWMCQYIRQTYGDPIAAWNHEQASHWY